MLNLQPIIARFVDNVLEALRGASLEEVREALAPEPPPIRFRPVITSPAPTRRGRVSKRQPTLQLAPGGPVAASAPAHDAPTLHEITDPAALLEAAVAEYGAPKAYEWLLTTDEAGPPESRVQPARIAEPTLREGESLARTSGAGVVIRRAKKA
jgi:hypothetical protein